MVSHDDTRERGVNESQISCQRVDFNTSKTAEAFIFLDVIAAL